MRFKDTQKISSVLFLCSCEELLSISIISSKYNVIGQAHKFTGHETLTMQLINGATRGQHRGAYAQVAPM